MMVMVSCKVCSSVSLTGWHWVGPRMGRPPFLVDTKEACCNAWAYKYVVILPICDLLILLLPYRPLAARRLLVPNHRATSIGFSMLVTPGARQAIRQAAARSARERTWPRNMILLPQTSTAMSCASISGVF